jgi:hypothetical protein
MRQAVMLRGRFFTAAESLGTLGAATRLSVSELCSYFGEKFQETICTYILENKNVIYVSLTKKVILLEGLNDMFSLSP